MSGGRHAWLAGPRSYQQPRAAIQLRYLQTLVEIGAEQNTIIVFPLRIDPITFMAGAEWLEANRSSGCPGAELRTQKLRTFNWATKERYEMSTSVELQELREVREPPLSKPLDKAVWQAWVAKGRAQDRRGRAARVKAVTWVSIAALLVAAALWSHLTTYGIVVRFVVAAGAIVVMLNLSHAGHYTFAAVFGALALLYNPVVTVFSFSGDGPRALVLASAAPFVASLAWPRARAARK